LWKSFKKKPEGPGGRSPYDYVMMFKVLILQRLYNLSDEQMQYQILDRLSFQRFLGQGLHSDVPDEKTIWLFREVLTKRGMIEKLFASYSAHLQKKGLMTNNGSIIDASFVATEKQSGRKRNDQRGQDSRGLEEPPCQTPPERHGRPVDEEE